MENNTEVNSKNVTLNQLKLFKGSELIEGFYRFIHENSLREEACVILQQVAAHGAQKTRGRKKKAKTLQ